MELWKDGHGGLVRPVLPRPNNPFPCNPYFIHHQASHAHWAFIVLVIIPYLYLWSYHISYILVIIPCIDAYCILPLAAFLHITYWSADSYHGVPPFQRKEQKKMRPIQGMIHKCNWFSKMVDGLERLPHPLHFVVTVVVHYRSNIIRLHPRTCKILQQIAYS